MHFMQYAIKSQQFVLKPIKSISTNVVQSPMQETHKNKKVWFLYTNNRLKYRK